MQRLDGFIEREGGGGKDIEKGGDILKRCKDSMDTQYIIPSQMEV